MNEFLVSHIEVDRTDIDLDDSCNAPDYGYVKRTILSKT